MHDWSAIRKHHLKDRKEQGEKEQEGTKTIDKRERKMDKKVKTT